MDKRFIVKEWLAKADKDIGEAEFLFRHYRSLEVIAFHIHQSAEKYLKGFLIFQGKELERIHDLVTLLHDVIKIDPDFAIFKDSMRKITNFYFESRYPLGYEVEYTQEEIKEALTQIKKLIKLIKKKTKTS